jgi:hypothetical protein
MILPQPINEFAQKYFAAESRASYSHDGRRLSFRTVDKKALARECKVLLESGAVEHLHQLSTDLTSYNPTNPPETHTYRLNAFAEVVGIKYPRYKRPSASKAEPKASSLATPAQVVHRAPAHGFDIREELGASFSKALVNGMTLSTIQAHAKEVLVDCHYKVQVGKATTGLQELMRNTGMTASQIAQIAHRL